MFIRLSVKLFSIRGLSARVSRVTLGVKLIFEFDSLLNLELLDSDEVSSILRKYSNRRIVARKVAFV